MQLCVELSIRSIFKLLYLANFAIFCKKDNKRFFKYQRAIFEKFIYSTSLCLIFKVFKNVRSNQPELTEL